MKVRARRVGLLTIELLLKQAEQREWFTYRTWSASSSSSSSSMERRPHSATTLRRPAECDRRHRGRQITWRE